MDNCVFCHNSANLQCQRCLEFYCSSDCQIADWKNHKFICISMPTLINVKKPPCKPSYKNDGKPLKQYSDINAITMRLPNIKGELLTRTTNTSANTNTDEKDNLELKPLKRIVEENANLLKNETQNKYYVLQNNLCKSGSNKDNICKSSINEMYLATCKDNIDDNKKDKYQAIEQTLTSKSNGNENWKSLRPLQKGFFNAIVQYIDKKNQLVWVSDEAWIEESYDFLSKINQEIREMENNVKNHLGCGSLVIVPFEEIYYRAVVTEKASKEVRVRLLDYGNDFLIPIEKCKKATRLSKSFQTMAFAIKLSRNLEIGQIIRIQIKKTVDDIFIVEEIDTIGCNIIQKLESAENFTITKESVLSTLNDSFDLKIFHKFDQNNKKCFGLILQKEKITTLLELSNILNGDNKSYYHILEKKISKGSFVAAQLEKHIWRRGLIIESYNNYYLVLFIDDETLKVVKEIRRLPKDFKSIPSSTVCVKFNEITNKKDFLTYIKESITLNCKLKGSVSTDNILECDVYFGNIEIGSANLTNFNGNYQQLIGSDTYTYPFVSDDYVQITRVISFSELDLALYIQGKYYDSIFDEIGKLPAIPLDKQLNLGKIVLCLNKKINKYFRAGIVSNSLDRFTYDVQNLETGDICQVQADCIKEAPNFVKYCPRIRRIVSLYILNLLKIESNPNKGIETLRKLCNEREKLYCNWENNVIELFYDAEKRRSLNKQLISEICEPMKENNGLNESLDATKSKDQSDIVSSTETSKEKKFKLKDLKVVPLKTGNDIRLLITDTSQIQNGIFTASIDDLDYYKKLVQEYQPNILKYCSRDDIEQKYCPQIGELCLTCFKEDKQWYRAFCLDVSNDGFAVMFVDYGNIQISKSEKIRKMTKNFMFTCYANTCTILDFPQDISKTSLEKLHEIVHSNSLITVDKVEKVREQEYFVTINNIRNI